jgi:LysM repeat protein/predicted nucleic acid-binding Zn ribbon protein
MAQEQISRLSAERRCPNCGTRVARDAESCFMCGHDLRIRVRRRRISWVDAVLVLAVVIVLVAWWRLGTRPPQEIAEADDNRTILPTNIPLLDETPTPTPLAEPTATLPPPAPTQTLLTHEVRSGETLLGIATQYGVTVEEIQSANGLTSELIRPGDQLTIPILSEGSLSVAADAPVTSQFEYIVRPNDTIISIALSLGSQVDTILAANNLAPNAIIRPGDRLFIPLNTVPQEVIDSSAEVASTTAQAPAAAQANPLYVEPRLIGPPEAATLPRNEAVLLRWVSVDVLQPNEWYVLLIYPGDGAEPIPSIWTKATSYRLDTTLAPTGDQPVVYTWQVSVIRTQTGQNGQITLEPASPPSAIRRFTWQ